MTSRAKAGAIIGALGLLAGVLLLLIFRTHASDQTPEQVFAAMGRFGFAAGVACLGSLAGAFIAFGDRLRGEGERLVATVCSAVGVISLAMMVTLLALSLVGPGPRPPDQERPRARR